MQTKSNGIRSRLLVAALCATTGIETTLAAQDAPATTGQKVPNLLIIQTDEHHFKTLGCYGGQIVKTPHIDRIAAQGALCSSFYATTPVCSPSRGALVSGRFPQNTPVVQNNIPLGDDIITFAEILRRQGYATGFAGKWHLDGSGKPQWAPKRSFGFEDNRFMFNRGHWKKFVDTDKGPAVGARMAGGKLSYALAGADEKTFSTDWLCDKAIEFIAKNKDKPFCYMVSLPDPHGPNTVRRPYAGMYADVTVPIPRSLRKTDAQTPKWAKRANKISAKRIRKLMPPYYGMVKCIDDNVGRVLAALEQHDILDDTIVVFTSDHGDLCGEHCRLNKGVPYEGSAKIPFLLRYPRKVPAGTVVDQALSCVDFLPSVLAIMGVKTAGKEQGRDASALLCGQQVEGWEDVTFIRSTAGSPWLCAVSDDHKLVYSQSDSPWLFDLAKDPDELTNYYGQDSHRAVARKLARALRAYCDTYGDPFGSVDKIKADIAATCR
ncbi:MAG: sulfatase [Planctomycetota bacterium]|nr:sulfatase [Planctomycetota bacterium]